MTDERFERLLALSQAADRIADANTPVGRRARSALLAETGLSPQGIDYALQHCLERGLPRATLRSLLQAQPRPRAHVLLAANVFTAPLRAICLALGHSATTYVRASRRSQAFCRVLYEESQHAFEWSEELDPEPGDSLWIYGRDETVEQVKGGLPSGVDVKTHGSGIGAAVLVESKAMRRGELAQAADALARDILAFDQRGCLSPRFLLVQGRREFAESACECLVSAFAKWEQKVPRGKLSDQEEADALRFESTVTYVGNSAAAGAGMVFLDPVSSRVMIPPVGRYLAVSVCTDPVPILKQLAAHITCVGLFNPQHLVGTLHRELGPRRYVPLGKMQQPPLDGPVDLRAPSALSQRGPA